MDTTKILRCILCSLLLAAPLPLIHAQANKDQPGAKADEKELEEKAAKLNAEGIALYQAGKFKEATLKISGALEIRKKLYPKDRYPQGHPRLAQSIDNLGALFQAQCEYGNAETHLREALAMRQALFLKDKYPQGHPDLANSLNNLGILLREKGEYSKAEPYLRDALAMKQALYAKGRYPVGHPDLAQSLTEVGYLLKAQREYVKAEPYFRDALVMRQMLYPRDRYPNHPELVRSLGNLGDLLRIQGEYAKAEPYLRDALSMGQALYPKGHPHLALSLNEMGSLLQAQSKYAKAEQYFLDAFAMCKALYPQGHPHVAISLNNLGGLHEKQGEYAKAELFYRDALAMWQALHPKDRYPNGHPNLATSLDFLGLLFQKQREYAKAETYLRDALAMRQALYPKDRYPNSHPDLAVSLDNLASLFRDQGQDAKAEQYRRDALAVRQALYPKVRPPNKDQPGAKPDDKGQSDAKPTKITGELKRDDPLDDKLKHPSKVHEFKIGHGQAVVISLKSIDFDAYLIVRDSNKKELAFNDDDPDDPPTLNSKLIFKAPKEDAYKIVVTSFDNKVGKYDLTIEAVSKEQVPAAEAPKLDAKEKMLAEKATKLNNEGVKLFQAGKFKEAMEKVAEALEIRKALYPKERYSGGHAELAQSLSNMGALLQAQGDYDKAEPYCRDGLAIRQSLFPKERFPQGHPDLTSSLNNLGALLNAHGEKLYRAGKLKEATEKVSEALEIRKTLYPKERYPQGHPDLARSLRNMGTLLNDEGVKLVQANKAKEAMKKTLEALEIRRTLYPKDRYPQGHVELAQSLNNVGFLLQAQREYAKAQPYYNDALAMKKAHYRKDLYPQGHADLADSLNALGALFQDQGEYTKAESYHRDALAMRLALNPKGSPDVAISLNNLGLSLQSKGECTMAERYYRDALAMRQALYPKDRFPEGHPELARSQRTLSALLNDEGIKLLQANKGKEAMEKMLDALEIRKTLFPKDRYPQGHFALAQSLHNVGFVLHEQSEYAKALPYFNNALAMKKMLYPKDLYPQGHPDLAISLNDLGVLLQSQGEYTKAELYHRDALAMRLALNPKGHPDVAISLNNLGISLQCQGEYTTAERYFRDALAMRRAFYPKDRFPEGHRELATSLNGLGFLFQLQGEYAKAGPYYRDALAMRQALYPKDKYPHGHPELAISLNGLGFLLTSQGEYAKAESYYRDALAMRQTLHPQGHPELAICLNNLGALLLSQGEYAKAEPFYRDALAMHQAFYPKDRYTQGHPKLAISLNNLGFLFASQGEYAKAERYHRDALAMQQALYPKDRYPLGHPELASSLVNLGALLQAKGEYTKAILYFRDALQMHQFLFDRLAETSAEAEALNFAASLPLCLDVFLSVQRRLPEDAGAFDLVWRSRAPLTRIMQRRHMDMYASQDPVAKQLALELQIARQSLAHLLLSPAKDADENKKKLDKLTEAKEEFEKRLAKQLLLNRPTSVADTSPQQLSKALPEGTAFIDLIRYTDFSQDPKVPGKKGESRTPRFIAFVLLSGKPAIRVDLKEAAPIEKTWAVWREAIVNNRPDRQAAAEFAALVWQPLRKHLPATTHTVWLNPDGQLAQVPWAALPGAKPNTILLEELAVAVVPHGAYLLQRLQDKPAAPDAKGTLLAVGGVSYEKAPAGAHLIKDLSLAPIDKLINWKALPGTASEQTQIAGLARKALKTEPVVLKGAEAGSPQVTAELSKVRYAHLATHGFFADPKFRSALQVDENQFLHFGLERKTAGARSPLVLSGLVLAGANLKETPERGIMTAEAVVSLRLEDLELAVLSACETGLGTSGGGEGVFGLQRAFHVAGARNVIASLWRVDDDSTAALMVLFYRNLWLENRPPLQALREAQLHVYRHPEQIKGLAALRGIDFTAKDLPKVAPTPLAKDAHAHTSQWAAFVLSGTGK